MTKVDTVHGYCQKKYPAIVIHSLQYALYILIGPPTSADTTLLVAMETTSISDEIPILTPRQVLIPSQESQHKPTSTEEVCYQSQALTGSLNNADLSHVRQQGTPLVDHQGIIFPNARRWTTAVESSGSISAQSSPFQSRHSLQPKQLSKPG